MAKVEYKPQNLLQLWIYHITLCLLYFFRVTRGVLQPLNPKNKAITIMMIGENIS